MTCEAYRFDMPHMASPAVARRLPTLHTAAAHDGTKSHIGAADLQLPCAVSRVTGKKKKKGATNFFRLLSDTMHSTSSSLQFVQGAPCSVTLHRTLRARQH